VRRILFFGLALSLIGLGPVPLSACALLTSKLAECATPKTASRCNGMDMGESSTHLAAGSTTSCCSISKTPSAQLPSRATNFSATPRISAFDATGDAPRSYGVPSVFPLGDPSPPPLQSLLCTFLI